VGVGREVEGVLRNPYLPCLKGVNHSCGQKSIIGIQNELIGMFCQYLALTVEANTSSLGRSILFNEWCSPNESDMAFGSLGAFWNVDLTGKNCLLVCTRNDSVDLKNINEKIQLLVDSKQPTRVLLVIPSELLQEMALPPRKILSIAEISTNFPLTRPEEVEGTSFNASEAYSVILVINQESMLIDPIQWEGFKKALLTWAENNGSDLSIPELTDNLFNERIPLHHSPRARQMIPSSPSGVYHFFDPRTKPKFETNYLISCGIPIEEAKLINKINSHDRNLSMIGILPNQIRKLFQDRDQGEKAFEELSRELFWKGYNIWNKENVLRQSFGKKLRLLNGGYITERRKTRSPIKSRRK